MKPLICEGTFKKVRMKVYLIFCLLLISVSCKKENSVSVVESNKETSKVTNAQLLSVNIVNNQIVISGSGLADVTSAKVEGSSFSEDFTIESKSATSLILNSVRNFNFSLNGLFSLILADAHGAATFQIGFTLQNGTVTAAMLHDMGAGDGDTLIYNNTTSAWETRPLGGIDYKGSWNPVTNTTPNLTDGSGTPVPTKGDYYLVSTADNTTTVDGINLWAAGDWVVFNGTAWQKIANSTSITSFNTRVGAVTPAANDYTWAQINKTVSDINDISNVNAGAAVNGQVLIMTGGNWVPGNIPAPSANTVGTSQITDGSITASDIAAGTVSNANLAGSIDQAKVTGLTTVVTSVGNNTTAIGTKANSPGAACAASNKLQWNGTAFTCVADIDTTIADTNTNASTLCTAGQVLLGGAGGCTNTTAFGGDFKSDGTIPMSGNLNLNNRNLLNASLITGRSSTATALTGTVSVTAATLAVTGIGTAFTTELNVGDSIKIGTEVHTVAVIVNDTNLNLATNHVAGAAGVASTKDGNIVSIQNGQGVDAFKVTGSGTVVGAGGAYGEFKVNGSDAQTSIAITNTATGSSSLILDASNGDVVGNDHFYLRQNNDLTSDIMNTNFAGSLFLGAGGNRILELTSTGRLGVGVVNPGEAVHVNGRVRATEFIGSGVQLTGVVKSVGAEDFEFITGDRKIEIVRATAGAGGHLNVNAGDAQNGGVDFNGGSLKLESGASTGTGSSNIEFSTAAAGVAGAATNATSVKMTLNGAGNLGVGTATPEEKIHTAGALRVDGLKEGADAGLILSDQGAYRRIESFGEPLVLNDSEQNIGVGHITPTAQFHIGNEVGSTVKPQLYIENNIANESATATLEGNTTTIDSSVGYLRGKNNGDILASINFTTASALDDGKIKFYTYDSGISKEAAVIENNGRFGVGLTGPEQIIHAQSSLTDNVIVSDVKSNLTGLDPLFVLRHETNMTFGLGIDTSDGNKFKIASGATWNNLGTNAQFVIDPATSNIGIGTSTPLEKIEVAKTDGSSAYLKFTNTDTGALTTDGSYIGIAADESLEIRNKENTPIKFLANNTEYLRITGNGNFGFGSTNPINKFDIKNTIAIAASPANATEVPSRSALRIQGASDSTFSSYFGSLSGTSQYIQVQNSTGSNVSGHNFIIQPYGGNTGIGRTNPTEMLDVAGDIRIGTGTTGCVKDADGTQIAGVCSSDERFKKEITDMDEVSSKLQQISPKHYYWRMDEFPNKSFGDKRQLGVIAQEVRDILPELVHIDRENYLRVDYSQLNLYVLKAFGEQYREIASLKSEVESLKNSNNKLLKDNEQMKKALCQIVVEADFCK